MKRFCFLFFPPDVFAQSAERGIALVELAIIFPFLLICVGFVVDGVGLLQQRMTLNEVVDEGYRASIAIWDYPQNKYTLSDVSLAGSAPSDASPGDPSMIGQTVVRSLKFSKARLVDGTINVEYGTKQATQPQSQGLTGGKTALVASPPLNEIYVTVSAQYDGFFLHGQQIQVTTSGPKLF